jgi:hypothetical protein
MIDTLNQGGRSAPMTVAPTLLLYLVHRAETVDVARVPKIGMAGSESSAVRPNLTDEGTEVAALKEYALGTIDAFAFGQGQTSRTTAGV